MKNSTSSKSRNFSGSKKGSGKSASISLVGTNVVKENSVMISGGNAKQPTFEICFDDNCTTLTVDDLMHAIRNGIDKDGMPEDQARGMAQHVLNFFGYSERIIDNILEPEDRDAFYQLEDTGILTTEREETTLYDGREWRIHYWLFRKERILELISMDTRLVGKPDEGIFNYEDVPEDIWQRVK
jgi:hypothetical protein